MKDCSHLFVDIPSAVKLPIARVPPEERYSVTKVRTLQSMFRCFLFEGRDSSPAHRFLWGLVLYRFPRWVWCESESMVESVTFWHYLHALIIDRRDHWSHLQHRGAATLEIGRFCICHMWNKTGCWKFNARVCRDHSPNRNSPELTDIIWIVCRIMLCRVERSKQGDCLL